MTSSPTTPKPKDPQTLLLIGPPGGGKTTLLMQLPSVCIVDVDLRLDSAEALLRRKNPGLTYDYETPALRAGKQVDKGIVWDRIYEATETACRNPLYKWIGIDGLSALNFHLIDWVLDKAKKPTMEQSDWIPFRQQLLKILNLVKLSGKNYVLTCHEEVTMSREGALVKRTILVDSRLRDAIGGWFSNVWRCYPSPGPRGVTRYFVNTCPSGFDDLKHSSPDIGAEIQVDTGDKNFDFNRDILAHL